MARSLRRIRATLGVGLGFGCVVGGLWAPSSSHAQSSATEQATEQSPSDAAPPTLWGSGLLGVAGAETRLRDGSTAERTEAALALGRATDANRAASVLSRALADESNRGVRVAILRSLTALAQPVATPALTRSVSAGRARSGRPIAVALGEIARAGDGAAVVALADMLVTPRWGDAARAGLARVGLAALPALLHRASQDTPRQLELVSALGRLRSHQATALLLVKATGGERRDLRFAALDALAKIGDPRAGEGVASLLDDEDPAVARYLYKWI